MRFHLGSSDSSYRTAGLFLLIVLTSVGLLRNASSTNAANNSVQQGIPSFAYVAQTAGNWDIYKMDEAGVVQQLTNNQGGNLFPKWSPDGQYILFPSSRDAPEDHPTESQLYVMRSDGSDVRRVTDIPYGLYDVVASWSPDGQQIIFASNHDGPMQIYVVNADGSNLRPLTSVTPAMQPNWSPNGDLIAYVVVEAGQSEIEVLELDDPACPRSQTDRICSSTILFRTEQMANAFSPVWSPDGTQIAFASNRDTNTNYLYLVYLVNSDGTNVHPLITDPGFNGVNGFSWSPDGTEILYSIDNEINIVNVNTGLSRSTGIIGVNPAWKPDVTINPDIGTNATLEYVPQEQSELSLEINATSTPSFSILDTANWNTPPENSAAVPPCDGLSGISYEQDMALGEIGYITFAWGGLCDFYNENISPTEEVFVQSLIGFDFVPPASGSYRITTEIELHGEGEAKTGSGVIDFLLSRVPGEVGRIVDWANPAQLVPSLAKADSTALLLIQAADIQPSETRSDEINDVAASSVLGLDELNTSFDDTIVLEASVVLNEGDTVLIKAGLETDIQTWGNAAAVVNLIDTRVVSIRIESIST